MSMTLLLIGVTVALSWYCFERPRLLERLLLWPPAIERQHQYDRFVTHGFVHADWQHLLFNMITLWSFGTAVERVFSEWITPVGYVLFYLSAIVVAILPTYLRHRHDPRYRSLGASGAVSAVLFAFILLRPWETIYLYFLPVPAILFAVAYTGYSVYMNHRGGDRINHNAHLSGAAYGVLFTVLMEPKVIGHFLAELGNVGG